jgi:hypothetical protein
LLCIAQNKLAFKYEYDNAGNRVCRKVITLGPNFSPPHPAPPDSTNYLTTEPENDTTHYSLLTTQYYIEKIAQTEIKIYPNPTTEKITLEISGWENLQTGVFKLYSLGGQLLQERPVHSSTTEVSLSGLPQGAYILKVRINDRTEDWKIIKK